jgi:hypothetical protein
MLAEVGLERVHRVEYRGRPVADARVQPAAGRDQQREARADLLIVNADSVAQNASGRRSAVDGHTTRHPGYAISQRIRKRVEEAFGWAKTVAGLRKMRHRGLLRVDWQFTLAMAAYDSYAGPNCSLRMFFNEPAHISNRAVLLRRRPFDLPQNASATAIPTIAEARTHQSQHFSAPC